MKQTHLSPSFSTDDTRKSAASTMPPSQRKKLRAEMSDLLFQEACFDVAVGRAGYSARTMDLADLYAGLMSKRYLNPRYKIYRSPEDAYRVFGLREDEFFNSVRLTKPTFDFVLDLINEDPVFHNNSYHEKRSVAVQLAITLEWYGGHGNGNAVGRVARGYGVGDGTVSTYVRRVQNALLKHYNRFVKWPSKRRRVESAAYRCERFGLDGVVGMVDGTHVIFDQKPRSTAQSTSTASLATVSTFRWCVTKTSVSCSSTQVGQAPVTMPASSPRRRS